MPVSTSVGEKLSGRVALVTGGTRGIGAAICESLANQGAAVAAGYNRGHDNAVAFQATLRDRGVTATIHQGNIGSAEDCARTVRDVIEQHGRLDILVNNAGITADRTVITMSADEWYTVLAVNLSGAFFCSQTAVGHMLERGTGRIVNISSLAGQSGNIGQANYAASKSGLFGLTKTLAREATFLLERSGKLTDDSIGVTVNTVTPGYTLTEMVAAVPDKVLTKITAQIPLRRLGRPEEIARIVHFLAADASSYITGQVWAVNGGMDM
jgi:acetoacetyl-CoA reductase/3-oxoacyl-[acyl-carrier protein] reductase